MPSPSDRAGAGRPAKVLVIACVLAAIALVVSWAFNPPDAVSIVVLVLLLGCPLAHVLWNHRH